MHRKHNLPMTDSATGKHASDRLSEYERSRDHIDAAVTIACRANNSLNVKFHLTKHMEEVASYWRSVLKRQVRCKKMCVYVALLCVVKTTS